MIKNFYSLSFLFLLPLLATSQQIVHNTNLVSVNKKAIENLPYTSNLVTASDVGDYMGKEIVLCGKIYEVKIMHDGFNQQALVKLSGSYINERLDVKLIFAKTVKVKPSLEKDLVKKNFCFSGFVIDIFETPQVYVNALTIVEEPEPIDSLVNNDKAGIESRELKLINNAYLLEGPKWKKNVITHLPAGSIIIVKNMRSGWCFIRVLEKNGVNLGEEEIYGYVNNQALGLNRKGEIDY